MNLIRSPAAWGNVLKGLAKGLVLTGVAAVSGSGAEIELAKLQGQIPGYVDARSAQLGSAALDKMTKNAGELFAKLNADQRGRLLMGAAPLMQALINYQTQKRNSKIVIEGDKITTEQFQKGMTLLLKQVQTGKKAETNGDYSRVKLNVLTAPKSDPLTVREANKPTPEEERNGWKCITEYTGSAENFRFFLPEYIDGKRNTHETLEGARQTYDVSAKSVTTGSYQESPIYVKSSLQVIDLTLGKDVSNRTSEWNLGESSVEIPNFGMSRPYSNSSSNGVTIVGSGKCQLPSGAIVDSVPKRMSLVN
jgi:hypothetical protein